MQEMYIRSTGVHLPPRRSAAAAVAAGECPPALLAGTGVTSVTVSAGQSPAELAVAAARSALHRAAAGPDQIALILHADIYHQGHDIWPVASYVQRETVANNCPALEIRQMSNGGMAALDLAAAYLTAAPNRPDALLTTADRFTEPGVNRWLIDPGTPYGDAGTALVLSRRGGFARLLTVTTHADAELEQLHRGDDPFSPAPLTVRSPVNFEVAKRAFTTGPRSSTFVLDRAASGQRLVLDQALDEAGLTLADARWFVLPHFGRRRLQAGYLTPYGIDVERTVWPWARTVGHLSAGDQFAGLDHLASTGRLTAGDRCVLVGVGAGFSWCCAVLEILNPAPWASA